MRAFLAISLITLATAARAEQALKQIPQLKSLPDSTPALQRQIDENDGNLVLGEVEILRITKPLVFDLAKHRNVAVKATGGVTIVMDGAGPALKFVGSHEGTASPRSFKPATWNERMPIVSEIEILGNHATADGIELVRTVEPIISRVSVRSCRHGIHLVDRNRNVIISDCHLYENAGVGVFLDDVNLHQINISNSHISYNRQGGIVVRDGNVRNLQVTGCDIEGNMPDDETPTKTANILIDVSGSADTRNKSIAEIAITGCTIQHAANYSGSERKTVAPGGANIRLAGKKIYPINSVTITGNVLSDTSTNIDIDHAHDVAINANTFFAPKPANLRVRNSQRVIVSGNTFNPRQFIRPGTITFEDCSDCIISNSTLHKFTTGDGALLLNRCSGFTISALNLSDCGSGIVLTKTSDTTIASCRVSRTATGAADISIDDSNKKIQLMGNSFGGRTDISTAANALGDGEAKRDHATKKTIEYVLELPQARRLKFPAAGGQSKILVTLLVFEMRTARITSISETGRHALSIVSINQFGGMTNKGFGGGAGISEEKLADYKKTLADLPPETPTAVLERLLIVRYPDEEGALQTKHYDLSKLPKSLREFRQIAVGVFKQRRPPRRGADSAY